MTTSPSPSVAIWGAGAVGIGIAATLAEAGLQPLLVGRNRDTLDSIRREGIRRTGLFGEVIVAPRRIETTDQPERLRDARPDYLLLCVKAFASAEIARALEPLADDLLPHTQLVLCQNGWGNEAPFLPFWPRDNLFHARVITGFDRSRPGEVEITAHAAPIAIGSLYDLETKILEPLVGRLCAGGIPSETTAGMSSVLWSKMLYNCALNPLGALTNNRYGELAADAATVALMNRVIEEVFSTLTRAGYGVPWPSAADYATYFYAELIPPTAAHRSSMLQDLEAGKETEIEALCGAVERLAASVDVETPTVSALATLIRAAQRKRDSGR